MESRAPQPRDTPTAERDEIADATGRRQPGKDGRPAPVFLLRQLPAPTTPAFLGFAFAGLLVGLAIIGGDRLFSTWAHREFFRLAQFKLWLFAICAQTAIWFAALLPLGEILQSLRAKPTKVGVRFWLAAGVIALLVVGFVAAATVQGGPRYPLPGHRWKLLALSLLGATVALIAAIGILLVNAVVTAAQTDSPQSRASAQEVENYLELRDQLRQLLAILGVILGAAILSTGALRNAILAYAQTDDGRKWQRAQRFAISFPRENVLIYGAYFSGVVALIYIPTYSRLLELGRALRDRSFPIEDAQSTDSWQASYQRRRTFEELLELQVTTSAGLRSGIAILAPLAASGLSLLLGQ